MFFYSNTITSVWDVLINSSNIATCFSTNGLLEVKQNFSANNTFARSNGKGYINRFLEITFKKKKKKAN